MMSSVLNHDNQQFVVENQKQPQLPDHLKCGEVFTWLCAGELYAVECKLCEDHPLCPLSEFPQHMQVWHTDWEQTHNDHDHDDNEDLQDSEDDVNDEDHYEEHNDEHALSFTTEDSGLFEPDDLLQSERVSNQVFLYNDELLEPFEQVLIEHDNTIDSIQISGDVNEEECLEEVNKQVAEAAEVVAEREPEKNNDFSINMTSKNRKSKQIKVSNEVTENERELRYLQEITESQRELNVMETNSLTETENVKEKSKTNLKNTKESRELSENETSEEENSKTNNIERKTNETSENESETSEIESKNGEKYFEKAKNNVEPAKKTRKSLRNLKETKEQLKDLKEMSENETEINENETKNKNYKEKLKEPRESQELREKETETSENETKNKNYKGKLKEPRDSQELREKETETSENETITSDNEKEIKENITNTFKYDKIPVQIPNSPDLYKNSKQNLTKTRKSSRNLRNNKEIELNFFGNSKKPQNFINSKRKMSENQEQLEEEEQEEMKQPELNENETPDLEKLPKFASTPRNEIPRASKTRTTRRSLRKLSRKFSEEELEHLEDAAKSSLHSNYPRNKKSKNKLEKPAKELNEEEEIHEKELNIEENINDNEFEQQNSEHFEDSPKSLFSSVINCPAKELNQEKEEEIHEIELTIEENIIEIEIEQQNSPKTRQSRRKPRYSGSEAENDELSPPKSPLVPLEKSTRLSKRSSKRKNTSRTNMLPLNDNLTPTKRIRRKSSCGTSDILEKTTKQTLVTHFFVNKSNKTKSPHSEDLETLIQSSRISPQFEENSINTPLMEETDTCSLNSYISSNPSSPAKLSSQGYYSCGKDSCSPLPSEPLSPLSPITEEEHFEFYAAKEKLNKHHISYLIQLYQEHSHLWDQSHSKFCEPQECRKSWQLITDQWNEFCKRQFSTAEIRIRLVTLCQRYVQERERLALQGELDEFAKFPYYEQMQFLEQQKSLQQRREQQEQQNEKILEVYQNFPLLWHVSQYKVRQAKQRAEAFENISKTLKMVGLKLSSMAVQKRIRSLRKCYRLEKIRFLHAQVEQTQFQPNFRHYERMKFLDKHIDPFSCRICGKIFENLPGFREHLEEENHGNVLQGDNENDVKGEDKETGTCKETMDTEKQDSFQVNEVLNKPIENVADYQNSATIFINNMDYYTEADNSCDILQTFTPLACTPNPNLDPVTNLNLDSLENNKAIIQEVLIFPCNTPAEPIIDSLHIEDQLMEEIMENVTNDDTFSKQSLDHFINSVTNCEELGENNVINEEIFTAVDMSTENVIILDQPDVITDQTLDVPSPQANDEEMISKMIPEIKETEQSSLENASLTSQCTDFSEDLKLNPEPLEIPQPACNDSDPEFHSSADISTIPLPDQEIHKMIELYRKYPQIWNPNHLDYNSRILRRQAWCTLTMEFNSVVGKQFSWRTLHRKLTDYSKYYKKLITEQKDYEELENKWTFYEDFKFLDDVLAVHDELQRSVHHRDNNFKIINIYETLPQLWDIKHPDYNKHSIKQRNIELMCNRLQEENNLQLTTERLKNRLIELRTQYRAAKRQRLKCERNQQKFETDFVFYEAFKFLDPHIDPFICEQCNKEFKKLTDYNRHLKREHKKKTIVKLGPFSVLPLEPGVDMALQNVCHICGIKFTSRSNLVHHVKRHEGIRNYECNMCPKKFFASHSLKVHIRSHTKECPYTCEKCGMSFVSASKLNQHAKRHFDKKDFQCDYCPKRFYSGFEKDRHERRHLNIRDKVCDICGKTFVAGSSYYTHMMLHSDTKRFGCDKCEMKFAQYAGLYKHKKRHHPA
ncbi:uncharacterized protein LOC135958675 [Calliphora vicina]|uniref:uncharacterized protein LOC135958675 n=1 Tax=Calliphora vicina TaxID=7373 RepID=UPI00325B6C64